MAPADPTIDPQPVRTPDDDPTIGRLVADATRDISSLIQSEIQLAKSELKVSVTSGGIAAALFVLAGFILLLSVIFLSVAIAYFISMTGLHLAWCFLIVFGVYVLKALLLAFVGYRKIKKIGPPRRAMKQANETKRVLTRKT
ncbi:MAG: phage holin family protein [Nocardioides sp.]|nr:phage holin family protein [Nocardioides sp.]